MEPDGRTSFAALQDALSRGVDTSLVYYVFDLLYLDGFRSQESPAFGAKTAFAISTDILLPADLL